MDEFLKSFSQEPLDQFQLMIILLFFGEENFSHVTRRY